MMQNVVLIKFAMALFLVVALSSCASNIKPDYNPDTHFDALRFYQFVRPDRGAISLDEKRIQEAIKTQLKKTAYQPAGETKPDFLIHYSILESQRVDRSGFGFGLGLLRRNVGIGLQAQPPIKMQRQGNIQIDLIKVTTVGIREVFWSAISARALTDNISTTDRAKLIEEDVARMLSPSLHYAQYLSKLDSYA